MYRDLVCRSDASIRLDDRFLVAQLGARMHYAVPRILHERGRLDHFYTDICSARGWPQLTRCIPEALRPPAAARLAGRVPRGVPRHLITAFNHFGFDYARRRAWANSPSEATRAHLWAGEEFCRRVIAKGFGEASAVYAFNTAALELLREARRRGLFTAVEQTIAPREIGEALLREESSRFPEWQSALPATELTAAIGAREKEEWANSDIILCGSRFVQDMVGAAGGPVDRCVVVPYGVDASFELAIRPRRAGHGLRVLTVGEVGLRKGSPYVLRAARLCPQDVEFRLVGECRLSSEHRNSVDSKVQMVGPVPRSAVKHYYGWADVFLLPSLWEGSATVVYEALAAGLPVICTPNTGSNIRHGVEGFVVPIRDAAAIAASIEKLLDPELRASMSENARRLAEQNRIEAYSRRLSAALRRR